MPKGRLMLRGFWRIGGGHEDVGCGMMSVGGRISLARGFENV